MHKVKGSKRSKVSKPSRVRYCSENRRDKNKRKRIERHNREMGKRHENAVSRVAHKNKKVKKA